MSSLVLLYSARTWYGTWLGPAVWGGLVIRSLLRICPRTASTLFFLMWSMSTVVQVDNDRVIVTQSDRRKNKSALARFIFHCAFAYGQCLSSKRRGQNPNWIKLPFLFSFRSWVSSVPGRFPFFSSAMSSLQKAHLRGNKSVPFCKKRSQFFIKTNSPKIHPPLVSCKRFFSLSPVHRAPVSAAHGLFPSAGAPGPVRLCHSSLQLSLEYTQTRDALTYTLSRVVTFLEGGAKSYYLFSENGRILFWVEFNLTPAVAPDFKWKACAMAHCATHFGKADFGTSLKASWVRCWASIELFYYWELCDRAHHFKKWSLKG